MSDQTIEFPSVAIIGSGLMGHGIAQIFALSGRRVWLNDVDGNLLEQAVRNIRLNLGVLLENGLIVPEQVDHARVAIPTYFYTIWPRVVSPLSVVECLSASQ